MMLEWANFTIDALGQIVSMIFSLDLGLGFSLGDLEIALMLIGIVASALIVKSGHMYKAGDINIDRRNSGSWGE